MVLSRRIQWTILTNRHNILFLTRIMSNDAPEKPVKGSTEPQNNELQTPKKPVIPLSLRMLFVPYEDLYRKKEYVEIKDIWTDFGRKEESDQSHGNASKYNLSGESVGQNCVKEGVITPKRLSYDLANCRRAKLKGSRRGTLLEKFKRQISSFFVSGMVPPDSSLYDSVFLEKPQQLSSFQADHVREVLERAVKWEQREDLPVWMHAKKCICEVRPQGCQVQVAIPEGIALETLATALVISRRIVLKCTEPVGPGASKTGLYKNSEYFCYNPMSYLNAHAEISRYRLPQPSYKEPIQADN